MVITLSKPNRFAIFSLLERGVNKTHIHCNLVVTLMISGGSRISVRGMRRASGPQVFFGRDGPHFLWQIVSARRRSQYFQRVGAPRSGSRISGWGDDGGAEGPERGAKRRSGAPREWGLGRGAVAPPRYRGLKFNLQICAF